MTESKSLSPIASGSLRSHRSSKTAAWTDNWAQSQGEQHMLTGYHTNGVDRFRHIIHWDMTAGTTWADVAVLHSAVLHVFTAGDHAGVVTAKTTVNNLKVNYHTKPWAQQGGGEALWNYDMAAGQCEGNDTYRHYAHISDVALHENTFDITNIVAAWMPASVKLASGAKGLALHNSGLLLQAGGGSSAQNLVNRVVLASLRHVNVAIRPYLVLTYDAKGGPGLTVLTAPDGDIARGTPQFFTGEYEPGRTGDKISSIEVQVTATGEPTQTWKTTASSNDVATSTFSVAVPESLKSGTQYNWTARVYNQRGEVTPYPAVAQVRWTQAAGTLTLPLPSGTVPTFDSVQFQATFHPQGTSHSPPSAWKIQLRTQLDPTDPTWEQSLLWDTGWLTVPLTQKSDMTYQPGTGGNTGIPPVLLAQNLRVFYGGPGVPAGTYSFRMQARDALGAVTAWLYGQVTTGQQYVPQPGDLLNLSRYGAEPPFRIRIYAVDLTAGKGRAPGKLLAELTDAANVGASEFYNTAGEFYFTLPAIHPQAAVIEPYQCHYELQVHTGQGWRGAAYGLITDFDATEDEVVFYGQDYLAVLGRMMEERFSPVDAELPTDKGGAKYMNQSIDYIIRDQLTKEQTKPNSPLGFITVGDIASMAEKVTIYASFKQRLPFIAGLIDSSRAGTGRATRLVAERDVNGNWKWRVLYNPGVIRDNLRLEYGGLVQGFRTVGFGAWGTAVNATGRTVTGAKVYSARSLSPGISEATYGAWPSAVLYQDIDDENDLQRRSAQAAAKVSKVGKQMGIGLRVGGLNVKDAWDITDHVPISIKRGVVDTSRFAPEANGLSYWTIWGWVWHSHPDGHTDMTLSLLPREGSYPPNPDLIPSSPILDIPEWQLADVPPTTSDDGIYWLDTNTGLVYEKQPDGTWVNTGSMAGPPGPPGPTSGAIGPYVWQLANTGAISSGEASVPTALVAGTNVTLQISKTDSTAHDQTGPIGSLLGGDYLLLDFPTGTLRLLVRAVPTSGGTFWNVPVTWPTTSPLQPAGGAAVDVSVAIPGPPGVAGPAGADGAPGPPGPVAGTVGPYAWVGVSAGVSDGEWGVLSAPVAGANNTLHIGKVDDNGKIQTATLLGMQVNDYVQMTGPWGTLRFFIRALPTDSGDVYVNVPVQWPATVPLTPTPLYVMCDMLWLVPGPAGAPGVAGPPGASAAADTTIPSAPVLSGLTSAVAVDADGTSLVDMYATVVHPTTNTDASAITDLFGTYVQFTNASDGNPDPAAAVPNWTNATTVLVPATVTVAVLRGAAGNDVFWARAWARDISTHVSAFSPTVYALSNKDTDAPAMPAGVTAVAGFRAVGLTWNPSAAADLMFNEVRYAPDNGAGAPDTNANTWTVPAIRVRTNTVVVTGLVVPTTPLAYWFQVRAVDFSGNVVTSAVDGTAVDYLANPEAGWATAVSAIPTLIGANDMAFNSVVTNFLTSGVISAGQITSGTLKVVAAGSGAARIEVWNGNIRVGFWDSTGLYIGTDAAGLPADLSGTSYTKLSDAGVTVYLNGTPQTAITPTGINATAINFGTLAGGMNLIKNSSFELAPFPTQVAASKDWNVAADWNATQQAGPVNVTNGAGAVNVTGVSY